MISNASYLKDKTFAHWVAMNKAAELRLADQLLGEDGQKGMTVMADRRWSWRVSGTTTPDPDIQLVEIAVWPEESGVGSPLVLLDMYLGRPSSYEKN